MRTVLVTGGAGFIGSNFVRRMLGRDDTRVVTFDKLTYAGSMANLDGAVGNARHHFVRGDICDSTAVRAACVDHAVDAIVHLAAESHVDRSIRDAAPFIATNVDGTRVLLDVVRELGIEKFVHVSTDEVYGALAAPATASEHAPLRPGNPYAASKAAGDLLCLAYANTYRVPVTIVRSCNNFGPYQHPEKLIPLAVTRAAAGADVPVYGNGAQRRDWVYVDDHCAALEAVLERGKIGAVYNVATGVRRSNLDVVEAVLLLFGTTRARVTHVADRPGHDRRYAPDPALIVRELGWRPQVTFGEGLRRTVEWYKQHTEWVGNVTTGEYESYFAAQYGDTHVG